MSARAMVSSVPAQASPPGTSDSDGNFLPDKAWCGFALQQCKLTAAHGRMAKHWVAYSHIDESQRLLRDGLA